MASRRWGRRDIVDRETVEEVPSDTPPFWNEAIETQRTESIPPSNEATTGSHTESDPFISSPSPMTKILMVTSPYPQGPAQHGYPSTPVQSHVAQVPRGQGHRPHPQPNLSRNLDPQAATFNRQPGHQWPYRPASVQPGQQALAQPFAPAAFPQAPGGYPNQQRNHNPLDPNWCYNPQNYYSSLNLQAAMGQHANQSGQAGPAWMGQQPPPPQPQPQPQPQGGYAHAMQGPPLCGFMNGSLDLAHGGPFNGLVLYDSLGQE